MTICWNHGYHAKILPQPVTSGPTDTVIDELKALLVELSDSGIDVDNLVNHVSEHGQRHLFLKTTRRMRQLCMRFASEASDEVEAHESDPMVPITPREATVAGQAVKIFAGELGV